VIEIPVEDLIYVVCALVGVLLLLITVVFDDILGGVLDAVGVDIGGTSLTPLLLGFVAMFGAGGLFATQILDIHEGAAAIVAVGFGIAGGAIASGLFRLFQSSETPEPFSLEDLISVEASVAIAIPAGRRGSVWVRAEGQTHEYPATAAADLAVGTPVVITGVAGGGVIVEPATPPPSPGSSSPPVA
jgi:membrane protein implicated in regulation of membrane protease activity